MVQAPLTLGVAPGRGEITIVEPGEASWPFCPCAVVALLERHAHFS
jgi:hypothetical protein